MKDMDEKLQRVVRVRIEDAIEYADSEVSKDREKATKYYKGDISDDLPQQPGCSGVVSRDLRDTVQDILPSLMRIFAGSEKPVEFAPTGQEDEEAAEQATDYANYILKKDNSFFLTTHSIFKDALLRKAGIAKVRWMDEETAYAQNFAGISPDVFGVFAAEAEASPFAEISEVEQDDKGNLSFKVTTRKKKGRVCYDAVPPEEFIISRDARDIETATLCGHRCYKRVYELVGMGYKREKVLDLAGEYDDLTLNGEADAREVDGSGFDDDHETDDDMRQVLYVEAYTRYDLDGDGIAERLKVITLGPAYEVQTSEMVKDHPFADFCPEPEPHTFYGECIADAVMDLQLIRSHLLRLGLDGLSAVVFPRPWYVEGQVNVKSLLDPKAMVAMRVPNAAGMFPTDKAAPQMAMEAFRQIGEVRAERTGQNQASMGLEPDALQSTSRLAVNALTQRAQARVEFIARVFAEHGFRRVYKLILDLITRYQDKERMIKLRGKWVPMDPRQWSPEMDVEANVGLGTGNSEEKLAFLTQFLQMQQAIMAQAGPNNPWVNPEKIRNALEDLCEAAGRMASRYVMTTEEWQQAQQAQQQQGGQQDKQDPAMLMAQAEMAKSQASIQNQQQKTQADIAQKSAELQNKTQSELLADDRERDKFEAQVIIESISKGIDPDFVFERMQMRRMATPTQVN